MTGRNLLDRSTRGLLSLLAVVAASAASGPRAELADMQALAHRNPVDLSCRVTVDQPVLGFDLRFHSGYRVTVPIGFLAAASGRLQAALRVTPDATATKPVLLTQRFKIPNVPADTRGIAILSGGFDLGVGRYRVDWMVRDASDRVCSLHWDVEAKPGRGEHRMLLTLGPNAVSAWEETSADYDFQAQRDPAHQQHIKFLLNLSPVSAGDILSSADAGVLLAMLVGIAREPGIGRVSLVAFNLREQRIVCQQEEADTIDFGALAHALPSSAAGTIDYRLLRDPLSETHFATKLLTEQLGARTESPDAIVIVGPKVTLDREVPLQSLRAGGAAMCPIFYLNYNSDQAEAPWKDTIGAALKAYSGAMRYNIVVPRDFGAAVRDILSRIVRRPPSASSGALPSARRPIG